MRDKSYYSNRYLYYSNIEFQTFIPGSHCILQTENHGDYLRCIIFDIGGNHVETFMLYEECKRGLFRVDLDRYEIDIRLNSTQYLLKTINNFEFELSCKKKEWIFKSKRMIDQIAIINIINSEHNIKSTSSKYKRVVKPDSVLNFGINKKKDIYRILSDPNIYEWAPIIWKFSLGINYDCDSQLLTSHKTQLDTHDNPTRFLHSYWLQNFKMLSVPRLNEKYNPICAFYIFNQLLLQTIITIKDNLVVFFPYRFLFINGVIRYVEVGNILINTIQWSSSHILRIDIVCKEKILIKTGLGYKGYRVRKYNQSRLYSYAYLEPGRYILDQFKY